MAEWSKAPESGFNLSGLTEAWVRIPLLSNFLHHNTYRLCVSFPTIATRHPSPTYHFELFLFHGFPTTVVRYLQVRVSQLQPQRSPPYVKILGSQSRLKWLFCLVNGWQISLGTLLCRYVTAGVHRTIKGLLSRYPETIRAICISRGQA